MGLICYSPLMQGLLTGRYRTADDVPDGLARTRLYSSERPTANHGEPGCETDVFHALETYEAFCARLGAHPATVALAWVRQRPGVTSFLVGARTPDELTRNLPALELSLDEAALAALDRMFLPVKEKVGDNADLWMATSRMR